MSRRSVKSKPVKPSTPARPESPTAKTNPWPVVALIMALFLAGLAPYIQTAWFDFVNFDDPAYVYQNPHVASGLTLESIRWAFTTDAVCNWHPLTWISLQLDVSLFGVNPGVHHLINAFIHALNGALLFLLLRTMTRETAASAWIAALFALHPLHVESVAWISERKDVLSGLFWILATAAYVRYARGPCMGRMALVSVLFALGLMAKPMLVTLPATLLLLDYWPLKRFGMQDEKHITPWRSPYFPRLLMEKTPIFALALLSGIITFIVQRSGGGVVTVDAIPIWARLANVPVAYVRYLIMTVWPVSLGIYYPHLRTEIPLWQPIIASVILVVLTASAFAYGRRHPWGLVGWLWYLGTLVPVIGIVQVGDQALADRYTYIPHIGLFLAATWILLPVARKHARAAVLVACAILAALGLRTHAQTETWRDTIALFEHSLRIAPDNYRAHKGLGVAYADERRQFDKAAEHCRRAIMLDPGDASLHYNLGNALMGLNRLDEAIASYRKALEMDPGQPNARYNLGIAFAKQQRYPEAVEAFRETLRLDPGNAKAHNNLGSAFAMAGQFEAALPHYRRAIELQPDDTEIWCNMGYAYSQLGRTAEAREAYQQALRRDPGNIRAGDAIKQLPAE
ncbi:MAG TPA: tetratricopeptide repeat protein [Candidatus Hydrogenedentes bacterium]|nr:tetratricopeptide repeat protein [Candidatus Hydrogenedentota bacterium]HPC18513.1 tetratricopeptide repeat protein [Candidatus Hydrogenedentota bacterium]HRT22208.1 tetratricopeptide repeat protein [Candidatus Hydrogenedentota bacterium]HRT66976.1 tetratricopeptide repeat protein [Candidatus Hydrogenedentota bacterium]